MRTAYYILIPLLIVLGACKTTEETAAEATSTVQTARLSSSHFSDEAKDWNVAPTNSYRTRDFHSPTPTSIEGAKVVSTGALLRMLQSGNPPVLIDALDGSGHSTLPGALWLPWAGKGSGLSDDTQTKFASALAKATAGDKKRAVVLFCLNSLCWLSHNAALRAIKLGYTNVYWYRGGNKAWRAAGLPVVDASQP